MSYLEIIKEYSVIINTLILVILLFRYLQDFRKSKVEREKLRLEIEDLKKKLKDRESVVINASGDEIKKYVIEPFTERINKTVQEMYSSLSQDFNRSASKTTEMVDNFYRTRDEDLRYTLKQFEVFLNTFIKQFLANSEESTAEVRRLLEDLRHYKNQSLELQTKLISRDFKNTEAIVEQLNTLSEKLVNHAKLLTEEMARSKGRN